MIKHIDMTFANCFIKGRREEKKGGKLLLPSFLLVVPNP
jgi:hypothetical protein